MNSTKILQQMLDMMRSSQLPQDQRIESALQILAWAKLSKEGVIAQPLGIKRALEGETAALMDAIDAMAASPDQIGQAFSGRSLFRLTPGLVSRLIEFAVRLSDTGMLSDFRAADALAQLPPSKGGAFALPPELADLLIALSRFDDTESAYVPWDALGQLAARASSVAASVYLETRIRSAVVPLVSLLSPNCFEVAFADPVKAPSAISDGRLRRFDVAISFPPFGERYGRDTAYEDLFDRFREATTSGSVLAIRHLLAQASRRVVVAVPNNLLFGGSAEQSLRFSLLERGQVHAVIAMSSGLLDGSNLPFSILVLDLPGGNQFVNFVNADDDHFREAVSKSRYRLRHIEEIVHLAELGSDSGFSRKVDLEEITANDANLQVSRYVLAPDALKLQRMLVSANTIGLGDIVETFRPMPSTKGSEGIEVGEIGAADLPSYSYIQGPGRCIRIDPKAAAQSSQFIRPHDIVLIIKGSAGKVGIAPPDTPPPGEGGWVVGQSGIILRLNHQDPVEAKALAVFLRSPLGQELLNSIVAGASIPLIQVKSLMQLQIIEPDATSAMEAAIALDREAELQARIDELLHEQARMASDLWALN